MELACHTCGQTITPNHINLDASIAHCPSCGALWTLTRNPGPEILSNLVFRVFDSGGKFFYSIDEADAFDDVQDDL